jgi:hypothetical protein
VPHDRYSARPADHVVVGPVGVGKVDDLSLA